MADRPDIVERMKRLADGHHDRDMVAVSCAELIEYVNEIERLRRAIDDILKTSELRLWKDWHKAMQRASDLLPGGEPPT
jgi:hypothetical protein